MLDNAEPRGRHMAGKFEIDTDPRGQVPFPLESPERRDHLRQ
jgi:hypothetical protein